MKIISAQPDDIYFLWQLELQLFNFHNLGINSEDIHVLIGYNPKKGLHYTDSGNKRGENNFNENLSTLNKETCGHAVANEISKYKKELDLKRIDFSETSNESNLVKYL